MSDVNQTQDQFDENDDLPMPDELTTLKARADTLGIKYHPSISLEKLRAKINDAVTSDGPVQKEDEAVEKEPQEEAKHHKDLPPAPETAGQRRKRIRDDALALVRVNITCMNPAKREWEGEIFTTGNRATGTIKKFVPFNTPDGYHIPRMMLDMLKARECQIFVTDKTKNGVSIRKGKLIKEFAIEILPQLTQAELNELARRQAMAKSID